MKRFFISVMVLAAIGTACMKARTNSNMSDKGHVQTVTAVSRVFGDGRKVATVILEYDKPISNKSLSAKSYVVEGKDVVRVYANTEPEKSETGRNGKYVVIEVKAELDLYAQPKRPTPESEAKKKERDRMQGGPGLRAGWSTGGDDVYPGNASVIQVADIKTAGGKIYAAGNDTLKSNVERCLVADDFKQYEFVSPYTGQVLPYNLYLPEDYDPVNKYPLVLFVHDAGVASAEVRQPLYQGTGAVSWAEPEAQARHKCIVVAPEYPVITVDDNWNYSHHLDATIALLKDLQTRYSIDSQRIYTTGQSMGCMSSIVMMLKEPDLFAGALLVAGKWLPETMKPLDKQNIWIISCEGDASSNTLQGQAVSIWRENGASVAEGTWDMESTPEQFTREAEKMRGEGTHLLFTHLTGGNHRATWFVAYGIEGVQDWLFEQHK
ncbi:MAG: alpha/beta hydrolase-fold protein [Bacteroides sp.]|nr:alpha/beta hydrolase-fold protein [Roseburia sp.]MCM1347671.1 alpha/beta hydrolase-fold protein [Bacteroides sp.]MCM1421952.1 alpha/beta hydrolase-fold protein [Bacteroides sp.]